MSQDTPPTWTDSEIREWWRSHGGAFHGPRVEHAYMEEARFLPLMREVLTERDRLRADVQRLTEESNAFEYERDEARSGVKAWRAEMEQAGRLCGKRDDEYPLKAVERVVAEQDRLRDELADFRETLEADLAAARQRIAELEEADRYIRDEYASVSCKSSYCSYAGDHSIWWELQDGNGEVLSTQPEFTGPDSLIVRLHRMAIGKDCSTCNGRDGDHMNGCPDATEETPDV